ncbi:hypothetical protein [Streptomyces sp. NBC_01716]|uniref:hypothetical protein n=1 Tax=Streptomyces sp. NBC_01716 TaxID=2975917 RepID=UPI002E361F6D|nr:hypothetical protein [Streptomyces sp. NBC_01716]
MTVGASGESRRAGWWALACLLTVLAAVVHIFVCAHGPQSPGAGGADSLSAVRPVAAPALVVHGGSASVDADRAADGSVFAHCPGADQPGWVQQDSQLKPPAMVVRAETVVLPTGVSCAGSRAGSAGGRRAPPDDGRAGLGVWRI